MNKEMFQHFINFSYLGHLFIIWKKHLHSNPVRAHTFSTTDSGIKTGMMVNWTCPSRPRISAIQHKRKKYSAIFCWLAWNIVRREHTRPFYRDLTLPFPSCQTNATECANTVSTSIKVTRLCWNWSISVLRDIYWKCAKTLSLRKRPLPY